MKLLSVNCHSWIEKDQINKIKILAKTIAEKKYDVIALQEVSQHKDSKIKYGNIRVDNYVEVLNEELKSLGETYNFVWDFSHMGYDVYEEGLAILTKHPINSSRSFYISKDKTITNYKSRKIVEANINVNGENITFYSCHLGWWNDEDEPFKAQADELIRNMSKELSFVMGDFNNNAFVRNEGYDYLIEKGLYDTYLLSDKKDDGITVPGEIDGWKSCKEEKRLDLILSNKEISVKISSVMFNKENFIISDHYGVEVEV